MLVSPLTTVFLHQITAPALWEQPLTVVHHLHIPVSHAATTIGGFLSVSHSIKGIYRFRSLSVTTVFRHVLLLVAEWTFQKIVVKRTLNHTLHTLNLSSQHNFIVHLAYAYRRIRVCHQTCHDVRCLPGCRHACSSQQISPVNAFVALYALPGEQIKREPILHNVKVQVLQYLLQYLILLPYIILLIPHKKQLTHRQLPEYRIPVTSQIIHSLTPIV